jgi:heptaprenyl diphosphate synthase
MNVNRVRQLASQYANYDLIQQYTELPSFPDFQIRLFLKFVRSDLVSRERGELYSLVASLIQIGLDTHDFVDVSDRALPMPQMRARQLQVLAGDYLSGRYYELLSNAEEIERIRDLADAICDVNVLKMNLYMRKLQRDLSGEQYLQLLSAIRTRLFLAFEDDIAEEKRQLWREMLDSGTLIEIMQRELEKLEKPEMIRDDYDGWALWEIISSQRDGVEGPGSLAPDKPEWVRIWVDKLGLKEKLRMQIEQTAERLALLATNHSDSQIVDIVSPMLEDIPIRSSGQYTYIRGGTDGSESQGKACSRSV